MEKDLQPAKAAFPPTNSPLSNAPCNTPGSWEPSTSKELSTKPPTLDVYRTGCPSAPCQAAMSSRGGKAVEQGQKSDCGHSGEAGQQTARRGRGWNKSITQCFSSGNLEEDPSLIRELQGMALSTGMLDLPCLSPHLLLPQFPFTNSQSFAFPYSHLFKS